MKSAIALLLGCTALVSGVVVKTEFFSRQLPSTSRQNETHSSNAHPWISFLEVPHNPSSPQTSDESGSAARSILLSKAETLLLIADAAAKYQVPEAFVTSIVAAESNFDCTAVSPKGAIGLMQLTPQTAQQFGADPTVPSQNVDAGTRYLRWLMERYRKSPSSIQRVIAAYNAGPGMVDRYRGVPPFRETRNYVTRVLGFLKHYSLRRK
jgi:soluble lytic murein transglycosylase-like protein